MDDDGCIHEDSIFDGDPSHKRRYLEENTPIDWLPEWYKTQDMRDVGNDPSLFRGGRFRFYNSIVDDIMIEEVV